MIRQTSALPVTLLAVALSGCASEPREGVEEKFNFWPLAAYETASQPEGHTVDVLWPLLQFHRSGDARSSRILPLYFHEDDGHGREFLNTLGLYWQTRDDPGRRIHRTLFPILWYRDAPDEWKLHVWPLYGVHTYGGAEARSRSDSLIYPLFDFDRRLDGSAHDLALLSIAPLLTLFRHRHSSWKNSSGAGRISDEVEFGRVMDELLRIYHSVERQPVELTEGAEGLADERPMVRKERSFLSLLDLLHLYSWRETEQPDGEVELSAHLFPLYFQSKDEQRSSLFVLPLFGRQTRDDGYRRNWIVPPLLSLEDDPSNSMSATDLLWPLWRHESRAGDDPGYHLRLLPLLWFTRRPDAEVSVVLPLYYRIKDATSEYLHLVPLYGRHSEANGKLTRTFVLPPLLISTRDSRHQLERTDLLWPLTRFESSRDGTRNWIFPLFFQRRSGVNAHLNILGLFDRQSSELRERTLLYPLYARSLARGEGSRSSWLPLLDWRIAGDAAPQGEQTSVLFPLSHFQTVEETTTRWVFPFYWWFDDGVGESTRMIWPFFGVQREADGLVRRSILYPLFFSGSSEDDSRSDLGILFPLAGANATRSDTASRRNSWLFPLFYNRVSDEDLASESSRTWVLWPLFSRVTESDGSQLWHSLFHLVRSERSATGTEEFSVLGALYRSRIEEQRESRSVAFLFSFQREGDERTLKLFHLIPIRW